MMRLFYTFVLIVLSDLIISAVEGGSSTLPTTIYVGGLFSPIVTGSVTTVSIEQAEHLAAFVMAINELNNKTDGIHDDILPHTNIAFAISGAETLKESSVDYIDLLDSFTNHKLVSTISALPSQESLVLGEIGAEVGSHQIVSVADTCQFNDRFTYPYIIKTVALESYEGMVIQNMMCLYFDAQKVVTISTSEIEDIILMQELMDNTYCNFETLDDITVRAFNMDFTKEIEMALASGARYFIIFMTAEQTAAIIEQGYLAGLFGKDTVIITASRGSTGILSYFSESFSEDQIVGAMTGFFTVEYWPNFYMNRTSVAMDFAKRWKKQPSRSGKRLPSGAIQCDNSMDSAGNYFLYRSPTNASLCTGLDFESNYDEVGLTIQHYTPLTYDATILLAKAVDFALSNEIDYTSAANIQTIIVNNISYDGVSGMIDIFEGMPDVNYYARGNRETGNQYKVLNFNPDLFKQLSSYPFVNIGYYSGDSSSFQVCEVNYVDCFHAVFSSPVGGDYSIPPSQSPPPIIIMMEQGVKILLFVLTTLILLLVSVCLMMVYTHRKQKIIKASQPVLLFCALFGGILTALRIVVGGLDPSNAICSLRFWFGHLAFVVIIGSIFVKSYRIHRIVNTKSIRRVKFSATDAFHALALIVFASCVYLIIAQSIGKPQVAFFRSIAHNQETVHASCSLLYPQFQTTLFVLEFLLLVGAYFVCYEVRSVPDAVNESKLLSVAMSAICLICIMVMPIVFILGLSPAICELIASIGFALSGFTALGLLFVPKLVAVYEPRRSGKVIAVQSSLDKDHGKEDKMVDIDSDGKPIRLVATSHDLLHGKTEQQRIALCQEQLAGWQRLLLRNQGLEGDGSGSGSKNSSSMVIESSRGASASMSHTQSRSLSNPSHRNGLSGSSHYDHDVDVPEIV